MQKAGGETAKEMCNRASDARCAGVPNLGRIGVDVEDFLPQLCGGSGGQTLRAPMRPVLAPVDLRFLSLVRLTVHAYYWM